MTAEESMLSADGSVEAFKGPSVTMVVGRTEVAEADVRADTRELVVELREAVGKSVTSVAGWVPLAGDDEVVLEKAALVAAAPSS